MAQFAITCQNTKCTEHGTTKLVTQHSGKPGQCGTCGTFNVKRDGWTICPACSGDSQPIGDGLMGCTECGAIFTDAPIDRARALAIVALDQPMVDADAEATFHFDFDFLDGSRVHGWAVRLTGRVSQIG